MRRTRKPSRLIKNEFDALTNTVDLFGRLAEALRPPPRMTIAEWAQERRVLSSEEAAVPGPWDNDIVPYGVEVMEAISDPTVREVVMMFGAQMIKTNIILNVIGYHIDLDPCPIMVVQPTITMGETFSGERLTPMVRDCKSLRGKIGDEKSRNSGNTILKKRFPGGYIAISGANSASSLKSRPVRVLLFDEVDEAPDDIEGQGDPVELAIGRTTAFPNKKIVLASTPTVKGKSRIETAYNDSTRERWTHKCPSCAERSTYDWQRLHFETMCMTCPHCGALHARSEWERAPGEWTAENPDHKRRGFHLSALDSASMTWADLVEKWIEAERASKSGNHSLLKAFVNMRLAQTWEERGEAIEEHALESRREVYRAELPDGVCVLTMGVDVQDTRLAYHVVGWGLGFENWTLEYGEVFGDPRRGEVWNRMDDLLARSWSYANGKKLRISRAAVDTGGHMTPQVAMYCNARESRGVYPIKGQAGNKTPLVRPALKNRYNMRLFMLGVDGIKADLMSWLRTGQPGDGYCHFPMGAGGEPVNGIDASFFAMLTAEKRVAATNKKGITSYEWVKPSGARNEAWDTFVYARAALRIMSNRDDLLLKRFHMRAMWNGGRVEEPRARADDAYVEAAAPAVRVKKRGAGKNARALQQGIEL